MNEQEVSPAIVDAPKKRQVSLSTTILVAILVAVGAFVLGTRSYLLPSLGSASTAPSQLDFSSLNELYATLRDNYDGDLDVQKLIDGAKHGMVDAAGDPYTVYLNAEESKEFEGDLNGTFEGIGAELGKVDGQLAVQALIGDSPAQKSGLQPKDIILKVNDEDVSGITVAAAVKKIRGPKGTTVKLSVLRGDTPKDITITRSTISTPSVQSEVLEGNVGYLRISRFSEDTAGLARKAAEDFKAKGITKVVLDLRGNGGGLLNAARDVSSIWLNNKVVVSERKGGATIDTMRSAKDAILEGVKTVVLVDGGSASASEIVAGALNDHEAATLVGSKTFGKGSVQVVEQLGDGSQLKVTVAKWYTPNGKNIHEEGITPDKEVNITEADVAAARDLQKTAALEILNAQ